VHKVSAVFITHSLFFLVSSIVIIMRTRQSNLGQMTNYDHWFTASFQLKTGMK
jgi:hypothetical protein